MALLAALLVCLLTAAASAGYPDGRPVAALRMQARDQGVVLRHGPEKFDSLGARDVVVWKHAEKFFMHYDAAGPTGWLAALAVSDDGRSWNKRGPILELGGKDDDDSATASYGVPYFDGTKWHLFYIGSRFATPPPELIPSVPYLTMKAIGDSPAGPWRKQREIVPFRPAAGSYYSDTACPAQVTRLGDEYVMFFSAAAFHGPVLKRTLGLARTRDLNGKWTVDPRPIVPAAEQIENASLYFEPASGIWFLFTNHVGVYADAGEYTDAIWVYWSNDPQRWDARRKALVMDGTTCAWSKRVVGLPSVVPHEGKLYVYYDGVAGASTSHVGRDVGLAVMELPLRPPP